MKLGVIIARFQVPELTYGQMEFIKSVEKESDHVLFLLGVPPTSAPTKRNTLTYQARRDSVVSYMEEAQNHRSGINYHKPCTIVPLYNMRSDEDWARQVDQHIDRLFPSAIVTVFGSRDSSIGSYAGGRGRHVIKELPSSRTSLSGTEVRALVEEGDSVAFRCGAIWAVQKQFAAVYPVVDMVIFRGDNVLLARKADDTPGEWRLIGGFVDGKDDTYEIAARREVLEETGLEVSAPHYVGSASINDWRFRGGPETVKSAVYAMDYVFGNAKAADDIAELRWFSVPDAITHIAEFHKPLLAMALKDREANKKLTVKIQVNTDPIMAKIEEIKRRADAASTFGIIKDILDSQLGLFAGEVSPDAWLREDLSMDSLDYVEVLTALEDEFNFIIPDEDVESLATVRELVAYIDNRLSKTKAA